MRLRLLGSPSEPAVPIRPSILAKGFRPFFLLASLFTAVVVPAWALVLTGRAATSRYFDPFSWHAHEMVFGFAVAVIAGFLLTAVANWTQRETATGPSLAALAALWIAGRVMIASPAPSWMVATTDLAFLPALAFAIGRPIVAARNRRNAVMLAALLALWLANLAMHLDALGVVSGWRRRGAIAGVDVVTLLMVIVAGRVVPMFTRNATRDETIQSRPRADVLAIASMVIVTVVDVAVPSAGVVQLAACAAACVAIAARTRSWGARRAFRDPLLWILHVGHMWIPAGLALRAVAVLDPRVPPSLGVHAITVGAVGALTLGMMARVALGHTGRPLVAPPPVPAAFVLITAAAVIRVAAPVVVPHLYLGSLVAAAVAWTLAFTVYLVVYAPVLFGPRADGKPG